MAEIADTVPVTVESKLMPFLLQIIWMIRLTIITTAAVATPFIKFFMILYFLSETNIFITK